MGEESQMGDLKQSTRAIAMKSSALSTAVTTFMAAILLACVAVGDPAAADTPLDVLGVEKAINDASRRAQETGDAIARAFADNASRVIAEWKKANQDLINSTVEQLDGESKKMFTEINNVASRIEHGEAVSFVDLQQTMATAAGVIDRAPWTSKEPAVWFSWPTIVVPGSDGAVTVHVLGPRIANANPRVISFGSSSVPVKKTSDNQIVFELSRSSMAAAEAKAKSYDFKLSYDVSKSVWYNPFSWWSKEVRERDIDLTVLPSTPGWVTLVQTIRVDEWEHQQIGPILVGGVGHDNTYRTGWGLTPLLVEQGWIVDKEKQQQERFDDNGGDGSGGSSCSGYDPSRFSDTFVGFNIQHGHEGGGLGGVHDAHQNCRIWIDLKRKKTTEHPLGPDTKPLAWTRDTDFAFDPRMTSYKIVMQLCTDVSYNISGERDVPYSLFEVLADKNGVKFRPRPSRDF